MHRLTNACGLVVSLQSTALPPSTPTLTPCHTPLTLTPCHTHLTLTPCNTPHRTLISTSRAMPARRARRGGWPGGGWGGGGGRPRSREPLQPTVAQAAFCARSPACHIRRSPPPANLVQRQSREQSLQPGAAQEHSQGAVRCGTERHSPVRFRRAGNVSGGKAAAPSGASCHRQGSRRCLACAARAAAAALTTAATLLRAPLRRSRFWGSCSTRPHALSRWSGEEAPCGWTD